MKKGLTRYERFLSTISPSRARDRFVARQQLGLVQRAYESVEDSRLRKKRDDARSADQINSLAGEKLRFQGRFLDENYDVAKSVLNTLVVSVVGEGIQSFPLMRRRNGELAKEANQELHELWLEWTRRPEVTREFCWEEAQQLLARSWFRDGECFNQSMMGNVDGLQHRTDVALSIEMIEADLCPLGLFDSGGGNIVRQGVEKDGFGAPVGYWFWKNYPTEGEHFSAMLGTPVTMGSLSANTSNLRRIDATQIQHLKMVDRIRQTRGVSVFASVYSRLDDLKEYEESERIAARIGAAFAFAVTKSIDSDGAATPSENRWREMDIAPGIIADNLQPGEKVESLENNRPSNLIKDFRTTQLQSVSGGTGASFSSLSRQYDGSYSSQRQELVESYMTYRTIRRRFVAQFVEPVWRDFVTLAVMQGLIDVADIAPRTLFTAAHLGAGIPYIDPRREVEADDKRIAAGLRSRQQTILERGDNPSETFRLIVEQKEEDDEAGVSFTSSPTGASSSEPGDDETLDEETDDEDMLGEDRGDGFIIGERYEQDGVIYIATATGFEIEEASA